jgi:eukaryotic-like serine/threonine-protein kinase
LDFGLAKVAESSASSSFHQAETVTSPAHRQHSPTMPGVILGTAAYMSPEQARGRNIDKRTDIWSFGVVLYECSTGMNPFVGESVTDTIGAILHKEADWTAMSARAPLPVQMLLRRCLRKDREYRLHDIADARIEIQDALSGGPEGAVLSGSPATTGASRRAFGISVTAALVFGVSTILFGWLAARPQPGPPPAPILSLSVVEDSVSHVAAPAHLHGPTLAIAPDGSRIAFLGLESGQSKLFVRELTEGRSRPLPGTEGAVVPFFSPDGLHIGFMSRGNLRTIALDGTPPREVCPAPGLRGGCWTEGDEIVFSASMDSGLVRVPASGGIPQALTQLNRDEGEVNHRFPEALPGGRFVVFLIRRASPDPRLSIDYAIGLVDLDTGDNRVVADKLQHARYADGFLVCSQPDGSIAAAPFDPVARGEVGSPTTVLGGVRTNPLTGTSSFAISQNGTLAYLPGGAGAAPASVVWFDRAGNITPALPTKRRYTIPRLSHDDRYLTVGIADPGPDIWRYDLKQDPPSRLRLTRDGASIFSVWSPDNQWLVHSSGRTGTLQIYRIASDGSGVPKLLQSSQHSQIPTSWSPDGRFIAYIEHRSESGFDVWIKPVEDDSQPWPVANESFDEMEPCFSPDSKWVAYTSTESGSEEIYIKAVSGEGARYPVSVGGGANPLWRGAEIFYLRGEQLMVVKVTTEPEVLADTPMLLFGGFSHTFIPARMYDAEASGERIIATLPDEQSLQPYMEIRVVTGWLDDVRRRLSGRGNE